MTTEWRCYV